MVLHEPGRAAHRLLGVEEVLACVIVPAFTASDICQSAVPEPTRSPRNQPFSIGPPETRIAGMSTLRRAHQQRRRGLVAAGEQHHPVDRVGAQRLLDVHGAEVAVEHRRRPQRALPRREDRELHRQAARLVDAVAHPLGEVAQMRVARRQLRPGVADADHRPPVEEVGRQPLVLHPASGGRCCPSWCPRTTPASAGAAARGPSRTRSPAPRLARAGMMIFPPDAAASFRAAFAIPGAGRTREASPTGRDRTIGSAPQRGQNLRQESVEPRQPPGRQPSSRSRQVAIRPGGSPAKRGGGGQGEPVSACTRPSRSWRSSIRSDTLNAPVSPLPSSATTAAATSSPWTSVATRGATGRPAR